MSLSNDSKQRLIAIAAVIIVGLLGINAFLLYNKHNQDKVIDQTTAELDEAQKLNTELEKQYYESLAELEEMRGNNEELNALIDQQKDDLKGQKEKIAGMIRTGKTNKSQLAKAREELGSLRGQVDQYLAEIQQLKEDKNLLTEQNVALSQERDLLQEDLGSQKVMNEELVTARAALVSEKEGLMEEKEMLSKKVNIASVIKVSSLNVTGEKLKGSGKAKETKRAKSAERLKVCFNPTENKVTNAGMEQFFVRIINPLGETLAVENMGSGVMTNQFTNEEVRYTQVQEVDYANEEIQTCFYWEPNTSFSTGEYEIEVYNKGFLAGKQKFTLK